MENDQHKIVDVWKKNQFKTVKLEIVQYKNKPFLQWGKKPKVDITKCVLSRVIELDIQIEEKQMCFCFEIIYDKEYVFYCKQENIYLYWINKIGSLSKCHGVFGYPLCSAIEMKISYSSL